MFPATGKLRYSWVGNIVDRTQLILENCKQTLLTINLGYNDSRLFRIVQ